MGKVQQMVEDAILFHGQIATYTGDCYKVTAIRKLKNLGVTTYRVTIGNTTVHYMSYQLPKSKDFSFNHFPINPYFMSRIRTAIRSSGYFIKSKRIAAKSEKILNAGAL